MHPTPLPCYAVLVPTPRTWLPRVEEILEVLQKSQSDIFDRDSIERLFELQRRMAINLMNEVGAEKAAGRFWVKRESLIQWVEQIRDTEAVVLQKKREASKEIRTNLAEVQHLRRKLIMEGRSPQQFPLCDEVFSTSFRNLSPNIRIERGRITVEFPPEDPESALRMLYELSMALSNDFNSFCALATDIPLDIAKDPSRFLLGLEADRLAGITESKRRTN